MSLIGPGEEHGVLERMVGEWNQTARLQGVPGMDATETKITASATFVLGGRFLQQVTKGEFMDMPWDTLSFFGFDRRREVYTLVGFDTLGTYYITAEGKYNNAADTLTLSGSDDDPVMGVVKEFTYVITFLDDGSFTTELSFSDEMHTRGEADSVTIMTATSTRR
ncbi:MAG: DUF1579 family protein [Planctomycetota bacterium]